METSAILLPPYTYQLEEVLCFIYYHFFVTLYAKGIQDRYKLLIINGLLLVRKYDYSKRLGSLPLGSTSP